MDTKQQHMAGRVHISAGANPEHRAIGFLYGDGVSGTMGVIATDCYPAEMKFAVNEANARRVAACWNACIGIETEKLEAVAFLSPHLPAGLKDGAIDYAGLKQQRDKLLGSLKDAMRLLKAAEYTLEGTATNRMKAIIAEIEAAK